MEEFLPANILLVEDDPGDQKLIRASLSDQRINNDLFITANAEQALDFLSHSKAGDPEYPKPDLILLDLNMPGMGGKDFLRHIKADDRLDTIPVVILTTSDSELDIVESYKLHAAGYIKKPVTLQEFRQLMAEMEEYWFAICKRVVHEQVAYAES